MTTMADREYHVHRRAHRALSRHHLPDVPAIHEARERFREALRAEPEDLTLEARLAYREAALDAFDMAVAAASEEPTR
jgi:hypothetical protein